MENEYFDVFDNSSILDVKTVRLKLNDYIDKGIFTKTNDGKDVLYNYNERDIKLNIDSINFFTIYSPIGVIGSYFNFKNEYLTFKHEYIFHALDSEIIYVALKAIYNKCYINIYGHSVKKRTDYYDKVVPLKVMVSTQGGRCYLHCYSTKKKSIINVRIDRIINLEVLKECVDYEKYLEQSIEKRKYMWGASIKNTTDTIDITLKITEKEKYILERLEKEKRNGVIKQKSDDTYVYSVTCYDALELLPWIRTFTCRIVKLESSCKKLVTLFYDDLDTMYRMYGENYDI